MEIAAVEPVQQVGLPVRIRAVTIGLKTQILRVHQSQPLGGSERRAVDP